MAASSVRGGAADAKATAEKLIGMQLITHQTGPEGQKVRRLYIEQGLDIARELYLGLVVDRETRRIAVMASTEGGVEIEKVAAETPEKILIEFVDPAVGLSGYQARKLAFGLGITQACRTRKRPWPSSYASSASWRPVPERRLLLCEVNR